MRSFILFAVGVVFGMGLYLSGMTQPREFKAFWTFLAIGTPRAPSSWPARLRLGYWPSLS